MAIFRRFLPAFALAFSISFHVGAQPLELPPEIRGGVNRALSQAVDAASVFASQGSIAGGRYTIDESVGPDSHFEIYRIPLTYYFMEKEDPIRPFLKADLGYFRATGELDPNEDFSQPNDFIRFKALSANLGTGVDWTVVKGLVVSPAFSLIYSHVNNYYDYNTPDSQDVLQLFDGDLFNWDVDVISYSPNIKAAYTLPFEGPKITLSSHYTYLYSDSFSSSSDILDVQVTSSLLQSRIDAVIPLNRCLFNNPLALHPFVQRTDLYQDVRDALSPTKYFHEFGLYLQSDVSDWNVYFEKIEVGGSYTAGEDFSGWNLGFILKS